MLKSFILRFALPVLALAALATVVAMPVIDRLLSEWFRGDVQLRAGVVMKSLETPLVRLLASGDRAELSRYLEAVTADERLVAILVCRADGTLEFSTPRVPRGVGCPPQDPASTELQPTPLATSAGPILISRFALPVPALGERFDVLIAHDLGFADRRRSSVRDYLLAFVAVGAVVLSLLFVAGAWLSLRRFAVVLLNDIRGKRFRDDAQSPGLSRPILAQIRQALREVEDGQRLEIEFQENWTPAALQHVVRDQLHSPEMFVISNREPYIHNFDAAGSPVVQVPASGMVTALEPVVRACAGTWIAHGSGTADRAVVDRGDGIAVPPQDPSYRLRRVWLTPEQEAGYYYGFANEGLWPLCHVAYVRPQFRASDWAEYASVNRLFASVADDEARTPSPVVLIQDYHFALLPGYLRARRPDATIILFWHIPWPNAETFGVCPWKHELLSGMLDSDILGFHTRYHCQNFLATVDRYVECQIDHEHMTVTVRGRVCRIAAYPISIEWPPRWERSAPSPVESRRVIRERFGLAAGVQLGVGVERWDFTKGILERFAALEHLLATRPHLRGKVTLLQFAAPSRATLPAYQELQQKTRSAVEAINDRYATSGWRPVILVAEHQEPEQVFDLYRAADFCVVNSLHDGMNLVAKEFVAARDDEDGVLILSTFAGASRELAEALIVNPYDAIETAAAIEQALAMSRDERRERMQLMRQTVKHNNVFRWAGRILVDAARVRQRHRLLRRSQLTGLPSSHLT